MPTVTADQLLEVFSRAIATEEGFFATKKLPTIPQRLNNPGDLRSWKGPNNLPMTAVNGYVDFPACKIPNCTNKFHPAEAGWAALRQQCWTNIIKRRLTFREFFGGKKAVYSGYAPSTDGNHPGAYAQHVLDYVKNKLGLTDPALSIDTPILTLIRA